MAIVTFTTDFGTRDGYAGAMKGVVLSLAPSATLVDLTHEVPAQDVVGGALALARAAPLFPVGTIHVAVVDPGVGGDRADLVVEAGGSFYVGPDNGLLSLAARGVRRIHRITAPAFRREPVSPTFHGRDVFAPTAARLAEGRPLHEAGPALDDMIELSPAPVVGGAGRAEGVVVAIDTFGNLVTSLTAEHVTAASVVELDGADGSYRAPLGRTFSDVESGALVAYVGSGGQLEIARRDGSAAAYMGVTRGALVRVGAGA